MAIESLTTLVDALRYSRLLAPAQFEELAQSLLPRFADARTLARELMSLGWLTSYQVDQLLLGRVDELMLGPYVLLRPLGAGGMGQVFLARHRDLGRQVALKVIRKERLAYPAIVERFHREIRAATQLSHPNIVAAFEAGQEGGTHFFAMEYVDGTDLSQLVKQRGFLAIRDACDAIRQAALGLQHAHERGLVHRDIKPDNLILTTEGGRVKLLDLGLALLREGQGDAGTANVPPPPGEGKVVGSPDFIAPEQSLDSRTVDIRADLYSLGCTFYYLLAGRVPFPGGSVQAKLLRHQKEEPMPLEQLRPEVPSGVAALVRKMMSKQPQDRHQTPAEVATALASPELMRPARRGTFIGLPAVPDVGPLGRAAAAGACPPPRLEGQRRRRLVLLAGWGLLLTALAGLLWLLLTWFKPRPDEESPSGG
jgi:serine/threonine protein kinase